jgi:hypothetical protein
MSMTQPKISPLKLQAQIHIPHRISWAHRGKDLPAVIHPEDYLSSVPVYELQQSIDGVDWEPAPVIVDVSYESSTGMDVKIKENSMRRVESAGKVLLEVDNLEIRGLLLTLDHVIGREFPC